MNQLTLESYVGPVFEVCFDSLPAVAVNHCLMQLSAFLSSFYLLEFIVCYLNRGSIFMC